MESLNIIDQRRASVPVEIISELLVTQMQASILSLIPSFDVHAHENGRRLRELLDGKRAVFTAATARILQDWSASGEAVAPRGYSYLITLLLTHDLLLPLILDITIPLSLCIWMAQTAVKVDSKFHLQLSSVLQDRVLDTHDFPGSAATRILDILSATMETGAMAPVLRKILLHPNAQIRSKATLLMGRGQTGISAIERLLPDEDPRVRANAVEALWGNPDPRVIQLFETALGDTNNRVVGNAIVGLYKAGCSQAVAAAFALATDSRATFRGTAAWAMGVTGDPRFLPMLAKLVGEPAGQVRKIVLKSLQTIKKSNAARLANAVSVEIVSSYVDGDRWRLRVCVKDKSRGGPSSLPATAFVIGTETASAPDYACSFQTERHVSIAFVLPHIDEIASLQTAFRKAVTNFRADKPDQGRWLLTAYSSVVREATVLKPFKFMGVEASVAEEVQETNTTPDLIGALCQVIENTRPSNFTRNIVVLQNVRSAPLDAESEAKLIAGGLAKGIALHVISFAADDQLQRISRQMAGSFRLLQSPDVIQAELERLYESFVAYHAIDVPVSFLKRSQGPVTVQVYAASAWGKCEAAAPVSGRDFTY